MAIRQLERAEAYLAAVAFMDVQDIGPLEVQELRSDLEHLRQRLVKRRDRISG